MKKKCVNLWKQNDKNMSISELLLIVTVSYFLFKPFRNLINSLFTSIKNN